MHGAFSEMADMCPLRWLLPFPIIQLTACAAANGDGRGLDDDAVVVTSEDEEDHSHEDDAVLVDALEVLRLSQPAPGDALAAQPKQITLGCGAAPQPAACSSHDLGARLCQLTRACPHLTGLPAVCG